MIEKDKETEHLCASKPESLRSRNQKPKTSPLTKTHSEEPQATNLSELEKPIFLSSPRALYKLRIALLMFLVPYTFSNKWIETPFKKLQNLVAFTIWTKYNVTVYFILVILTAPLSKPRAKFLGVVQLGLLVNQFTVIIGFWLAIVPFIMIQGTNGVGSFSISDQIYDHSVPFLSN